MMTAEEAARVRQAACETTSPDILRHLANDPSVTVRVSLALNKALPDHIVAILATDADVRVRRILNRNVAPVALAVPDDARQRARNDAVASLTAIVADAGLRARTCIADAVRDMPDGPRDIVLRLAQDPAPRVCEPVIRFSPMLTEQDLVDLVTAELPPTTRLAVANRPRIGAIVCDAIADSADPAAIGALLANHTANIREATLDTLAAQSEEHTDWQEPLIRRPRLPMRAQRMLAEIVSGHLLNMLTARSDLDPKAAQTARASIAGRAVATETVRAATLLRTRTLQQAPELHEAAALHQPGKPPNYTTLSEPRRDGAQPKPWMPRRL